MAGEGERHGPAAPIVATAAPFYGAGAVGLRRVAVVEKESRVPFQSKMICLMREDERRADELAAPVAAPFGLRRIEQNDVLAVGRFGMVLECGVKITDVIGWIIEGGPADTPLYVGYVLLR